MATARQQKRDTFCAFVCAAKHIKRYGSRAGLSYTVCVDCIPWWSVHHGYMGCLGQLTGFITTTSLSQLAPHVPKSLIRREARRIRMVSNPIRCIPKGGLSPMNGADTLKYQLKNGLSACGCYLVHIKNSYYNGQELLFDQTIRILHCFLLTR